MTHDEMRVARMPAQIRVQTADNIRSAIAEGRFRPGERLVERELCEMIGVSRTSIREALRTLEVEGLVTTTATRGTLVRVLSPKEVQDLYDMRAILEGFGARQFALNASEEQLLEVLDLLQEIDTHADSGDNDALLTVKDSFYELIFAFADNFIATETFNRIQTQISAMRLVTLSMPGRCKAMQAEMREIAAAIESREPDRVEAAFQAHVRSAGLVAQKVMSERYDDENTQVS